MREIAGVPVQRRRFQFDNHQIELLVLFFRVIHKTKSEFEAAPGVVRVTGIGLIRSLLLRRKSMKSKPTVEA
jgi:hypothetical protein